MIHFFGGKLADTTMACSEEELFSKAVPVKLKSQDREERLAVCVNVVCMYEGC